LNKCGTTLSRLCPLSHLSDQNKVFFPSPTYVTTAIEKKALADWWTWMEKNVQGLSGSVFCNQSHLILNAQPSCCMLEMPSPPNSGGLVTLGQATKQCPPNID
jgi:hypothetical protein